MWLLSILTRPGFLPSLAALLIAGGVETDSIYLHHSLEVVGALVAFIGLFVAGEHHAVQTDRPK